jgi:hypothetical protein
VATDHVPTDTPAANLLWNAGAISQENLLLSFLGNSGEQANRAEPFAPQKETLRYESRKRRSAHRPKLPNRLSHPDVAPDSDRAKRPPLAEPSATGKELNPGARVEGLGNFGKPTGEIGTVERTNVGV